MKHAVVGHWHSPMACDACVSVVIISKRAVSEGLGSDPIIISFPTSLHSLSSTMKAAGTMKNNFKLEHKAKNVSL